MSDLQVDIPYVLGTRNSMWPELEEFLTDLDHVLELDHVIEERFGMRVSPDFSSMVGVSREYVPLSADLDEAIGRFNSKYGDVQLVRRVLESPNGIDIPAVDTKPGSISAGMRWQRAFPHVHRSIQCIDAQIATDFVGSYDEIASHIPGFYSQHPVSTDDPGLPRWDYMVDSKANLISRYYDERVRQWLEEIDRIHDVSIQLLTRSRDFVLALSISQNPGYLFLSDVEKAEDHMKPNLSTRIFAYYGLKQPYDKSVKVVQEAAVAK